MEEDHQVSAFRLEWSLLSKSNAVKEAVIEASHGLSRWIEATLEWKIKADR